MCRNQRRHPGAKDEEGLSTSMPVLEALAQCLCDPRRTLAYDILVAMRYFSLTLLFCSALPAEPAGQAVRAVLYRQGPPWNRRDVRTFMQCHTNPAPNLSFR